ASTHDAGPAPATGWSRATARTLALVSGGLGVVGVGVGTAFMLDANAKKSDYRAQEVGGQCDARCVATSKDAVAAAGVATIGFVAGGVLVATGAVLWLTAPSATPERRGVALAPSVSSHVLGASLSGQF